MGIGSEEIGFSAADAVKCTSERPALATQPASTPPGERSPGRRHESRCAGRFPADGGISSRAPRQN